jgi:hypothetical protein
LPEAGKFSIRLGRRVRGDPPRYRDRRARWAVEGYEECEVVPVIPGAIQFLIGRFNGAAVSVGDYYKLTSESENKIDN